MDSRLYCDYIKVDPDFLPVFSSNSDRVYPNKWKSFYPHDSFKEILSGVIAMLEKSSSSKDLPQWMSGAYGTGKTYASFVIKHLLEDPLADAETYLVQNNLQSLFVRLKAVRDKGDILVIEKSSSAGIDSPNKLLNAIAAIVKKALTTKGYAYTGAASRFEKVIETLKDADSPFNFAGAFRKYKQKFTEFASPEEVVANLEELGAEDAADLLETVIDVAERESFNWSTTPEEIIDWLEDVRKGNNLQAIVFIWDEFTEFFKSNQNGITGLQEIAMAAPRINFYFFLITHSDYNQLIRDERSRKIMRDRFAHHLIRLGENTALALLGQALHHSPDLKSEWDRRTSELWGAVKREAVDFIKSKDMTASDDDFKNLFPMHPYASYLLKFIAQDISSNQRTMFRFLCDEIGADDERANFRQFIACTGYEYGGWNFLTADYLWDYFFRAENTDLEGTFLDVMSHYANFAAHCDSNEERRVLKVVLLLYALNAKNTTTSRAGITALLRPTRKNIIACFAGTPLGSTVTEKLTTLEEKNVLGSLAEANDTLYVMDVADTKPTKEDREDALKAWPFTKVIDESAYKPAEPFMPRGFLTVRCLFASITPTNARIKADAIRVKSNQIPVFYLFAQSEVEQAKASETIKTLFGKFPQRCVVVDITSLPFNEERYSRFIDIKANERKLSKLPNKKDQVNLAKKNAENVVKEWENVLAAATLRIYSAASQSEQVSGGVNVRHKLEEINSGFYGCGLEAISVNEKLFAMSGFKDNAAKIGMGKETTKTKGGSYAPLNYVAEALARDGVLKRSDYWKALPQLPISRMKIEVKKVIDKGFNNNNMVAVTDIWQALTQPPFGLLPCMGSVWLMGFLLKEYADTVYYKQDINSNTVSLNYSNLSELIFNAVKETGKAVNQFIVRQKPEHISFCQKTGEIFKIAVDKRNSIADISKNIKIYLSNNHYPLWSLIYYAEEAMNDYPQRDALIALIRLLCEFVNPQDGGRDKTKVAEEINAAYLATAGIEDTLAKIVVSDCLRDGMMYYLALQKPELHTIASYLKLDDNDSLALLLPKLTADSPYLWQKGDIDRQIDNLYIDLRLLKAINGVLTTPEKSYSQVCKALDNKLNLLKLPASIVKEVHTDLWPIMQQFLAVHRNSVTDRAEAADLIDNHSAHFLEFFNNQYVDFAAAIKAHVDSAATDEETGELFNDVPSGVFFSTIDDFALAMRKRLKDFRKEKKTNELFAAWRKISGGSPSPAVWSEEKGIPILCMFAADMSAAQRRIFAALNGELMLSSNAEIDGAIAFIEDGRLKILTDMSACEKAFIEYFCDDYAYVIEDAAVLRDTLRKLVGNDVYNWYFKKEACKDGLRELAKKRYQTKYRAKAKEKVHTLTAEQAQRYLDELLDDPLFGIKILQG